MCYEERDVEVGGSSALLMLLIGAVLGAGIAFVFAHEPTRNTLKHHAKKMHKKVKDMAADAKQEVKETAKDVKQEVKK